MPGSNRTPPTRDQVRFCRSIDGARIAYATHGEGPPLLVNTCWLSHLQHDWESPVWRHFLEDVGRFVTIIRYDERGYGLSDWDVSDFSLEARVGDLEAVADDAGLDQFAMMAMAQGGPVAISYTVRHPKRVSRLMFYDSYANRLRGMAADDIELEDAFDPLIKAGWGRPESNFRRVFSSMMIPGATEQQMRWVDDLMRVSVSASTMVRAKQERNNADVSHLLPQLRVPTLVLHALGDRMNSFEHGRHLASSIRGARLVALESQNHILLEDQPAWLRFQEALLAFLRPDRSAEQSVFASLSDREREVLTLIADGLSNTDIAARLEISEKTVRNHTSNLFDKLGVWSRAQAIVFARDHGFRD